jgi:hypothetical protein
MRFWTMCGAFLLVGPALGCGKPKLEEKISAFELQADGKLFMVQPIRREQEIQVTGTATGAPVNVYIYLEKKRDDAEHEILSSKFTTLILAKQDKVEAIDLKAMIPANETAVVHLRRGIMNKPPTVQLLITNK